MGLAASQARLLLLTARKSDLEYRAQCITNTEMILAMQTEAVARKYSQKISNQALFFLNKETNTQQVLDSTNFLNMVANQGYYLKQYAYTDAEGKAQYADYVPEGSVITYLFTPQEDVMNNDGSIKYAKGQTYNITADEKNSLPEALQTYCRIDHENSSYNDSYDPIALLEGINSGMLKIFNPDGTEISLSGNTGFTESYYTDDDAEAEAEYKRETAAIQVKEKRLQNDLQQVESQQKACETEIDSVKKVIEKNIEKTFKVFS